MKAFIIDRDFVVLLNMDELNELEKNKLLESDLLAEGELKTGKLLRLLFKPEADEVVSKEYVPVDLGWEVLKKVILTINQKGLNQILSPGLGICYAADLNSDFLIAYNKSA